MSTLSRLVRSLYFRERLAERIPEIEGYLRGEMKAHGLDKMKVDGFIVKLNGESLDIVPTIKIPDGQLSLWDLNIPKGGVL